MTGTLGADTTLLIDFFTGLPSAVEFVKKNSRLIRVSELVVYEFLCGNLTEKESTVFLNAMQSFPSVGVSREAVLIASDFYRHGRRSGSLIGHQDCLIAGSYLAAGIKNVVTRNKKHFSKIKTINVIEY